MAALAAGVATSMAQNVYSLNIVGYYNVPVTHSLSAMACSLTAGTPQNRADQILPYSDTDNIQIWTGVKFIEYDMDSGSSTGWADPSSGLEIPLTALPVLSPGKGFFYGKSTAITNVTIVGQVPTGTNVLSIPAGLQLVASMLPAGGLISTTNGSNIVGCPVPDGSNVQKWTGVKWLESDRDSGSSTGWSDAASGLEIPEPTVSVGESFFFANNNGSPVTWTQILNP